MITVREARVGDGAVLREMAHSLAASHDALSHFTCSAEDFEAALFCDDPIIGALIAFVDGDAAGSAVWHRSFSTNRGKEVMYLEDLSVLEKHRRKGVAKVLMQELARVAKVKSYPSIFWMMQDWNEGARKLYLELGAEIESGMSFCRIKGDALARLAQ